MASSCEGMGRRFSSMAAQRGAHPRAAPAGDDDAPYCTTMILRACFISGMPMRNRTSEHPRMYCKLQIVLTESGNTPARNISHAFASGDHSMTVRARGGGSQLV